MLATPEALTATIKGLIEGAGDITANNALKYFSTRISNTIVDLRREGLLIETRRVKAPSGKQYGVYFLIRNAANLEKARSLYETYTQKLKPAKKNI